MRCSLRAVQLDEPPTLPRVGVEAVATPYPYQCETAPARFMLKRCANLPTSLPPLPIQARDEYDRTIQETETAYKKILESTQTLLSVLKKETEEAPN